MDADPHHAAADPPAIAAVPTGIAAFVGGAPRGPVDEPVAVRGFAEYSERFGGLARGSTLGDAVRQFFAQGGEEALVVRAAPAGKGAEGGAVGAAEIVGSPERRSGLWALAEGPRFDLLSIPPFARDRDVDAATWDAALDLCRRRRAMLLVDAPAAWRTAADAEEAARAGRGFPVAADAALFFPRLVLPDPLDGERPAPCAPAAAVAGLYARSDRAAGVWKAPAGPEAVLRGVGGLSLDLGGEEARRLAAAGVNVVRRLPGLRHAVWGARTTLGADGVATIDPEWKYVPVRRLFLFLEESIDRGTEWAVFEPNDEPLWARLRHAAAVFLDDLFRRGAFAGRTAEEAYFVRCDATTTTAADRERGTVTIEVGFAPARPAEFVIVVVRRPAGRCS